MTLDVKVPHFVLNVDAQQNQTTMRREEACSTPNVLSPTIRRSSRGLREVDEPLKGILTISCEGRAFMTASSADATQN